MIVRSPDARPQSLLHCLIRRDYSPSANSPQQILQPLVPVIHPRPEILNHVKCPTVRRAKGSQAFRLP